MHDNALSHAANATRYCRFQLAFENKVPKFVTNVRNYISKVRN